MRVKNEVLVLIKDSIKFNVKASHWVDVELAHSKDTLNRKQGECTSFCLHPVASMTPAFGETAEPFLVASLVTGSTEKGLHAPTMCLALFWILPNRNFDLHYTDEKLRLREGN